MTTSQPRIPILIGGCERSGTTLLGSLIGGHSKVICLPASQFITDAPAGFAPSEIDCNLPILRDRIAAHYQFANWPIDLPDAQECVSYPHFILQMVQRYAEKQGKLNADFWVSHSPANIRHAHLLLDFFPNAKFLHILRDGRAVAASFRKAPWRLFSMQRLASTWMQRTAHGLALEITKPENVKRVHYETLVNTPEAELIRIASFCGLDFEPSMLTGEGFSHHRRGDLVGHPPDASRADDWQQRLSAKDIEAFEYFTKDFLLTLGYTRHTPHLPRPVSEKQKAIMLLQDAIKYIIDTVDAKLSG